MIGILNAEEIFIGTGKNKGISLSRQIIFDMPRRRRKIVCVRNIFVFNYRFRF